MKFGNIFAFLVNNPESPMLKLPKEVTRISDGMVKGNETVLSTLVFRSITLNFTLYYNLAEQKLFRKFYLKVRYAKNIHWSQ